MKQMTSGERGEFCFSSIHRKTRDRRVSLDAHATTLGWCARPSDMLPAHARRPSIRDYRFITGALKSGIGFYDAARRARTHGNGAAAEEQRAVRAESS